ncbi:hypothetical protein ACFQNF_09855 [Iodobacter arcticus]|uniref:Uncharacterized protein n=1 Tax=Iodobacter arcticus TaxID=590593 RepID=A0ABW2QXI7_9NEIS
MANQRNNEIDQTRLVIAALAASFAKALGEQYPTFLPAFESELEKQYQDLRSAEVSHVGAMETLRWVKEFLG